MQENFNLLIPLITVFLGGFTLGLILLGFGIYLLKHRQKEGNLKHL